MSHCDKMHKGEAWYNRHLKVIDKTGSVDYGMSCYLNKD